TSSFFFSMRRRHTRSKRDWSSDVCSSDLAVAPKGPPGPGWAERRMRKMQDRMEERMADHGMRVPNQAPGGPFGATAGAGPSGPRPGGPAEEPPRSQGRTIQGHFEPVEDDEKN